MASPVIWQNHENTITLVDLPDSIATAQGSEFATSHHLLTSAPLQHPFPSNEPKTSAARAKLKLDATNIALHGEYECLLQQALDEIHEQCLSEWCRPRPFVEASNPPAKKRRLDTSGAEAEQRAVDALPDYFLSNLARQPSHERQRPMLSFQPSDDSETSYGVHTGEASSHEGITLVNKESRAVQLKIASNEAEQAFTFQIPSRASFQLGDCAKSREFRQAVRKRAELDGTRSAFDFILLDPPWHSRSVKRTHKTPGSTYAVSTSVDDIRDLILDTHLEILMEDDCLVGIWITNKPSVRELVLGENGIFECWGLQLVKEWIWLKTTVNGEPVTPLDGVWRKPYEVLLLGRRRAKLEPSTAPQDQSQKIERRVIVGVPDLHSRKPCLKTLIEPMMKDPTTYRALEVFSRHLVAGWWSWGDECIKFNWEGYWHEGSSTE